MKKRPELSYTAIPNGKCSLDVSVEENENGFAKQPANVFPQRVNKEQLGNDVYQIWRGRGKGILVRRNNIT